MILATISGDTESDSSILSPSTDDEDSSPKRLVINRGQHSIVKDDEDERKIGLIKKRKRKRHSFGKRVKPKNDLRSLVLAKITVNEVQEIMKHCRVVEENMIKSIELRGDLKSTNEQLKIQLKNCDMENSKMGSALKLMYEQILNFRNAYPKYKRIKRKFKKFKRRLDELEDLLNILNRVMLNNETAKLINAKRKHEFELADQKKKYERTILELNIKMMNQQKEISNIQVKSSTVKPRLRRLNSVSFVNTNLFDLKRKYDTLNKRYTAVQKITKEQVAHKKILESRVTVLEEVLIGIQDLARGPIEVGTTQSTLTEITNLIAKFQIGTRSAETGERKCHHGKTQPHHLVNRKTAIKVGEVK